MNAGPAVSSRLALQRFFARTDFLKSKISISRRSGPGSATPFKGSRPDRLVFMSSTLSTRQGAKTGAHDDISAIRTNIVDFLARGSRPFRGKAATLIGHGSAPYSSDVRSRGLLAVASRPTRSCRSKVATSPSCELVLHTFTSPQNNRDRSGEMNMRVPIGVLVAFGHLRARNNKPARSSG